MLYAILKLVHLSSIIVWVGGMVFAHFALRPAVAALEPPARLRLMHDTLGRFFGLVLPAACLTLITGLWMIGHSAGQAADTGGAFRMPLNWTMMATLGILMIAIFGHIRFALFKRLGRAVGAADWKAAGAAMAALRKWVGVNLALGVIVVVVAMLG